MVVLVLVEEGEEAGRTSTVRAGGGRGVCADRLYPACAGFPVQSTVTDRVSTWITCWKGQPFLWSPSSPTF